MPGLSAYRIMKLMVLISALLLVSCATPPEIEDAGTKEEALEINRGMTGEQVLGILGEPEKIENFLIDQNQVVTVWFYKREVSRSTEMVTTGTRTELRYNPLLQREVEVEEYITSPVIKSVIQNIKIAFREGKVSNWESNLIEDKNLIDD